MTPHENQNVLSSIYFVFVDILLLIFQILYDAMTNRMCGLCNFYSFQNIKTAADSTHFINEIFNVVSIDVQKKRFFIEVFVCVFFLLKNFTTDDTLCVKCFNSVAKVRVLKLMRGQTISRIVDRIQECHFCQRSSDNGYHQLKLEKTCRRVNK